MTIHRFFIGPESIDEEQGTVLCQSQKLAKQVRKVLRLENGAPLDILDGHGNIYHCILADIIPGAPRDLFQAKIIAKERCTDSASITFTIAMPLIKTNRFEWALEKITELGVNKIVPVALSRSIIKGAELLKLTRWRKIIEEAAEQSEHNRSPELTAPLGFINWLEQDKQTQNKSLRLICVERQSAQTLEEVLYNFSNKQMASRAHDCEEQSAAPRLYARRAEETAGEAAPTYCAIAVGAEGGFTEEEIQSALAHNFVAVSLGPNILRSETAALTALAISRSWFSRVKIY